jgi:hypothetical protein
VIAVAAEQSSPRVDWLPQPMNAPNVLSGATLTARLIGTVRHISSRHDVLTSRSGAVPWHLGWIAGLLSARLAGACLPRGWLFRRLR